MINNWENIDIILAQMRNGKRYKNPSYLDPEWSEFEFVETEYEEEIPDIQLSDEFIPEEPMLWTIGERFIQRTKKIDRHIAIEIVLDVLDEYYGHYERMGECPTGTAYDELIRILKEGENKVFTKEYRAFRNSLRINALESGILKVEDLNKPENRDMREHLIQKTVERPWIPTSDDAQNYSNSYDHIKLYLQLMATEYYGETLLQYISDMGKAFNVPVSVFCEDDKINEDAELLSEYEEAIKNMDLKYGDIYEEQKMIKKGNRWSREQISKMKTIYTGIFNNIFSFKIAEHSKENVEKYIEYAKALKKLFGKNWAKEFITPQDEYEKEMLEKEEWAIFDFLPKPRKEIKFWSKKQPSAKHKKQMAIKIFNSPEVRKRIEKMPKNISPERLYNVGEQIIRRKTKNLNKDVVADIAGEFSEIYKNIQLDLSMFDTKTQKEKKVAKRKIPRKKEYSDIDLDLSMFDNPRKKYDTAFTKRFEAIEQRTQSDDAFRVKVPPTKIRYFHPWRYLPKEIREKIAQLEGTKKTEAILAAKKKHTKEWKEAVEKAREAAHDRYTDCLIEVGQTKVSEYGTKLSMRTSDFTQKVPTKVPTRSKPKPKKKEKEPVKENPMQEESILIWFNKNGYWIFVDAEYGEGELIKAQLVKRSGRSAADVERQAIKVGKMHGRYYGITNEPTTELRSEGTLFKTHDNPLFGGEEIPKKRKRRRTIEHGLGGDMPPPSEGRRRKHKDEDPRQRRMFEEDDFTVKAERLEDEQYTGDKLMDKVEKVAALVANSVALSPALYNFAIDYDDAINEAISRNIVKKQNAGKRLTKFEQNWVIENQPGKLY